MGRFAYLSESGLNEKSEKRMKTATAPRGMPCRRGRYKYCGLDIFLVCAASPRLLAPGIIIDCLLVVVVIVACNTAANDSVVGVLTLASITISCSTDIAEYRLSVIGSSITVIATDLVSTRCAEKVGTGAGSFLEESTIETGIFLEEGLDTASDILLEGDLDREAGPFFEELNTGSGFIKSRCGYPYLEP
jgi:hypothetical protein